MWQAVCFKLLQTADENFDVAEKTTSHCGAAHNVTAQHHKHESMCDALILAGEKCLRTFTRDGCGGKSPAINYDPGAVDFGC
jgi:hypothetical protein